MKHFSDEECVGIQLLPDHLLEIEEADYLDDEEKEELFADRDDWLERGDFVWWWGKDYDMNAEGEVEST